jgi:hypothetical protein
VHPLNKIYFNNLLSFSCGGIKKNVILRSHFNEDGVFRVVRLEERAGVERG